MQGIGLCGRQRCVSLQKVSIRNSGHSGQKVPLSKTKDRDFKNFPPVGSADNVVEKMKMQIRTASTGLPCRFQVVRRLGSCSWR